MRSRATTDPMPAPPAPASSVAQLQAELAAMRAELATVRAERDQLRGLLADLLASQVQLRAQLADTQAQLAAVEAERQQTRQELVDLKRTPFIARVPTTPPAQAAWSSEWSRGQRSCAPDPR
jgi:septal ring factor EnvC (AmiA/AmiB activator)